MSANDNALKNPENNSQQQLAAEEQQQNKLLFSSDPASDDSLPNAAGKGDRSHAPQRQKQQQSSNQMLDSPTFSSSGATKLKKNLTETAQIMSQMADRYAKKNNGMNNNNAASSAQPNPFLNTKISEKDSINSKRALPSNHVGYLLDQGIILNYGGPWQAEKYSNKIELQQLEKYRRKIGSVCETTKGGDKEKIKEALNAHKHKQELQRISTNRSK